MKDIELLLPMLRKLLDERGLNEVKIELTLQDVPFEVLNNTYSKTGARYFGSTLAKQTVKKKTLGKDTITLESKYF